MRVEPLPGGGYSVTFRYYGYTILLEDGLTSLIKDGEVIKVWAGDSSHQLIRVYDYAEALIRGDRYRDRRLTERKRHHEQRTRRTKA